MTLPAGAPSARASAPKQCQDKVRQVVGAGASRLSSTLGGVNVRPEIAAMIDHTLLKPDASQDQIAQLCYEARKYGFATVCVNPTNVRLCAQLLKGSPVGVCTVVGFPLGATPPEVKAYETQQALDDGATEVDMVINIGALKSKDYALVERDIATVARTCHAGGVLLKVIIEAALLTDEEKAKACELAKAAGADYVKTSTGFGPGGATAHDVELMRRTVGPEMGIKAAGGIRSFRGCPGHDRRRRDAHRRQRQHQDRATGAGGIGRVKAPQGGSRCAPPAGRRGIVEYRSAFLCFPG